jgi:putative membrane protein
MNASHVLTALLAQPGPGGWWGGPDGHAGWAGGWFWVFPLTWLVILAALVSLLAWYLIRSSRRSPHNEARRILAERYARGELTVEEYRERVGELR